MKELKGVGDALPQGSSAFDAVQLSQAKLGEIVNEVWERTGHERGSVLAVVSKLANEPDIKTDLQLRRAVRKVYLGY